MSQLMYIYKNSFLYPEHLDNGMISLSSKEYYSIIMSSPTWNFIIGISDQNTLIEQSLYSNTVIEQSCNYALMKQITFLQIELQELASG